MITQTTPRDSSGL